MRPTSTVAIALLALAPLAGCGSGDDASATAPLTSTITPSASTGATASADESPSAASGSSAITTSYPDIGLSFDDLPHVTGSKRAALDTWTRFDAAVQHSNVSLTLDPAVARLGADDLAQGVRNNIAYLKQHHQRYAGTTRERFTRLVGANDDIVVFDVCYDGADAWLDPTDDRGKREPLHPAHGVGRIQVSHVNGLWKVTSSDFTEQSC